MVTLIDCLLTPYSNMHDKLTALYDTKHRSSKDSFDRSEDNQPEMYDAYVLGQSPFLEGQFGWFGFGSVGNSRFGRFLPQLNTKCSYLAWLSALQPVQITLNLLLATITSLRVLKMRDQQSGAGPLNNGRRPAQQ